MIFLTLISMGVYWNTLSNDFVAGDRQFILRNPHLGNYKAVLHSFTSDYWKNLGGESFIYYRPITIFSHFIDFKLYGFHPAGHHFSNMVFHTIVTLQVYQLLSYLFSSNPWSALVGAGLFALHPIHTHSVSYVMGRTDILAALFYLWGLILLIGTNHHEERHRKTWKIVGACFCFLLSLLCKEIAITLPAIFFIYRFCWPSEHYPWKNSDFWIPFLSLCLTLALYLLIRSVAVGISVPEGAITSLYSLWQRVCLAFITYGFYFWKLFLPLHLCYYCNIVIPASWGEALSSPLFWVGLTWTLSFPLSIKWTPKLSFALGWIVLTLLPVINIIPIATLAKENFLYLPSIGFCLLLSMVITNWWWKVKSLERRHRTLFFIPFILIGTFYTGVTMRRNTDYKDPVIFLESTLKKMTPVPPLQNEDARFFEGVKNFYTTYKNLGILYQEQEQWEKSAQSFENALKFTPSYCSPEYATTGSVLLGTVYEKMGELEKAFHILLEARSITSQPSKVDNLLGVISIKLEKKEQAEFYLKRAIQEDDTYALAHYNLGVLYMETHLPQKGSEELLKAARLNPNYIKILSRYGLSSNYEENHNTVNGDEFNQP